MKLTLFPILSQNMVYFALTTKSKCKNKKERKNFQVFFVNFAHTKIVPQTTIRKKMVHFAETKKSVFINLVEMFGLKCTWVPGCRSFSYFLENPVITN